MSGAHTGAEKRFSSMDLDGRDLVVEKLGAFSSVLVCHNLVG